jgi:hypothetical protein
VISRESSILGDYFLKIAGVFGMFFCWAPVFFPKRTVVWKGGNRAPLSRRSKLVSALAWTAWCLVVFGIAPIFCAALFAIGVLSLFVLSRQDRKRYAAATGISWRRAQITKRQLWSLFCVADALFLVASLFAVIRDSYSPPTNGDQRFLHYLALGYLAASCVAAIVLYRARPRTNAPGQ